MASPGYRKLYPDVIQSDPDSASSMPSNPKSPSSHSRLYPSLDVQDLVHNLFPETDDMPGSPQSPPLSAPPELRSAEELMIRIPGVILHLIDRQHSVQLACGDLTLVRLLQGESAVAVLASVGGEIQWPLARDEAAVKLDDSHYFFSLRAPEEDLGDEDGAARNVADDVLNYGLTIASKGQEELLKELDGLLEHYSSFSVQTVSESVGKSEVLDGSVARQISPAEMESGGKTKEVMEKRCAAYWTTLAPNVEDYGGTAAKMIAAGSGQLIKGILWCGDVTVDRLKWGHEVMVKRLNPGSESEISPQTLKRIKRVKRLTKMSEKMACGVLSGFVKVSGFFTSSLVNSKVGKKFFGLLPGEVVLASLDGFNKVCDAVEVAGRNVMSTSSTVTTGLVSHKYGDKAGRATGEGLGAAGHAMGTAWAVFKIRKVLNPKSVIKPSSLAKTAAKAAASEVKARNSKK